MDWPVLNRSIVFTHDFDFATALALTHSTGPSVLQIRGPDVLPDRIGTLVLSVLRQHDADLAQGALILFDERRLRVRILPF
jgi:predicted nuclease of predicted toxin-antitoxin system